MMYLFPLPILVKKLVIPANLPGSLQGQSISQSPSIDQELQPIIPVSLPRPDSVRFCEVVLH